jgi:hypothetical protein
MQITVHNDFFTDGPFTQAQIDSFLADEQTAINILDATFTDNISVVFDVGFGSYRGQVMPPTSSSSARLVWIGGSRASPQFTHPVRPISYCATSTPAHSKSTILRPTPLSEPHPWVRSDWIGGLAVSPSILRPMTQALVSLYKRWPVLTAARQTPGIRSPSVPTCHNSRC